MDPPKSPAKIYDEEGPFDAIYNFRDVGATVNGFSGSRIVKEFHLYRSGRLDDATSNDQRKLVNDYGIKTVIDLRTKSEHLRQAQRRQQIISRLGVLGQSLAAAEGSTGMDGLGIPGVETIRINFVNRRFEMALLWQLSWWGIIKFFVLMILQFRIAAIAIIGKDILRHRGLIRLSFDSLEYCGDEIRQTLEIMSDQSSYPLLIHCTQGKDRTGLVTIITLLLLDTVSIEAVTEDYTLSWEGLEPVRGEILREVEEIGLDENYVRTPPTLALEVMHYLEDRWGGVEAYLDSVGFGREKQERLISILKR
ncbi:hypothetical protein RUND412_002398 [Rhizina undulata]